MSACGECGSAVKDGECLNNPLHDTYWTDDYYDEEREWEALKYEQILEEAVDGA